MMSSICRKHLLRIRTVVFSDETVYKNERNACDWFYSSLNSIYFLLLLHFWSRVPFGGTLCTVLTVIILNVDTMSSFRVIYKYLDLCRRQTRTSNLESCDFVRSTCAVIVSPFHPPSLTEWLRTHAGIQYINVSSHNQCKVVKILDTSTKRLALNPPDNAGRLHPRIHLPLKVAASIN